MVEMKDEKAKDPYASFFGVAVMVQLHAPLAMVVVTEKSPLPYSDQPREPQWIPSPDMIGESFVTVQMMKYAVLRDVPDSSLVEMHFIIPGKHPGTFVELATLIDTKDIAYVTRVVFAPEPPQLLVQP